MASPWNPLGYVASVYWSIREYFIRPLPPIAYSIDGNPKDHYTKAGCRLCRCPLCRPCGCGEPVPTAKHFRIMFTDLVPRVYDCHCIVTIPDAERMEFMTPYFCDILKHDFNNSETYVAQIMSALLFVKEDLDKRKISQTIDREKNRALCDPYDGLSHGERHIKLHEIERVFLDLRGYTNIKPARFRKVAKTDTIK